MHEVPKPRSQFSVNLFWSVYVGLFFLLFALVLERDEIRSSSSIGLSSTKVATVPLFNAWTIGWNADRLQHGFKGYWDAPIFYPANNTFAFSEPQPATLLVAPIVWSTGSIITGYKSYLILSLFLNGFFAALLLKRLGHHWLLQLLGGAGVMLLPIIHHRIDILQLAPVWGILWFWSSIFELVKHPGLKQCLLLGCSYAACFTLCVHHALFASLLVPAAGIVLLPQVINWKFAGYSILAVLIGLLLASPIVLPIYRASKEYNFAREEKLVQQLSAKPIDYLSTPENSLIHFEKFKRPKARQFCVGWYRIGLACMGVALCVAFKKRRRWMLFLLLTGIGAYGLSLGPNLQFGEWSPWESLTEYVPGISQVRSVYRFAWFVQLSVVLLAVEGLAGLSGIVKSVEHKPVIRIVMVGVMMASCVILVCEVWPEKTKRAETPSATKNELWVNFIRYKTPQGRAIACLPISTGRTIADYEMTTRWMYLGHMHQVPMVNGYSGFFPDDHLQLRKLFNLSTPSKAGLEELAKRKIYFVVVVRDYCSPQEMLRIPSGEFELSLVLEDPVGIDVYRLKNISEIH